LQQEHGENRQGGLAQARMVGVAFHTG
jgi:hypothetical protein